MIFGDDPRANFGAFTHESNTMDNETQDAIRELKAQTQVMTTSVVVTTVAIQQLTFKIDMILQQVQNISATLNNPKQR